MQCVLGDRFNRGFHVALHLFLYGIVCFLNGSGDPFRKPIDWVSYDLNVPPAFKQCKALLSTIPGFLLGNKISLSAESDLGLCPKNPQVF